MSSSTVKHPCLMQWTIALLVMCLICVCATAQPLRVRMLDNDTLNRWMITTTELKPYSELLESINATEEEAIAFEAMSPAKQDQKITDYLKSKDAYDVMTQLVKKHGWYNIGEYVRKSTQIGNAIARYLQEDIMAGLPPEEAQAMREKSDPAVAAVTDADLEFVRKNISTLQTFMKLYSQQPAQNAE